MQTHGVSHTVALLFPRDFPVAREYSPLMTKTAYRLLLGALLLTFAAGGIAAASPPLSPDAVVAHASTYDGQSISVAGVAKNVQTHTGRMGTVVRYDLCATQCIHVFDRSGANVTEGSTVTATGAFHAQFQPHGANPNGGGNGNTPHQGGWHGNFPTTNVLFIAPPGGTPH